MNIQVVILAAGQGKRMYSHVPKVLHQLAGKSLLEHVIQTAQTVAPTQSPIVVCGHQGEKIREMGANYSINWIEQSQQLGTGHAVLQALPAIADENRVLVLYGDVPLISAATLAKLIEETPLDALGVVTAHTQNPYGYGRIKRDAAQHIISIIEEKDANPAERHIGEVNTGIYLVPAKKLKEWLPRLSNHNAQHEYYLTDIIPLAVKENMSIHSIQPLVFEEVQGVNDRLQLAQLERFYQQKMAESLLRQGVTLYDPARLDVRGEVTIGRDVTIDVNVILEGKVVIGDGCLIGPNTVLSNTVLGNGVIIKANTHIEGAIIAADCVIGPFARIRPETTLAAQVHVGNFVEIKKSSIAEASKISHLSYIGDATVGKQVNIGAGTITCNYDGVKKHQTTIGDDVFVGSCTQLIAPVAVGNGATIGAGSTITEDVPANKLTLSRAPQQTVDHWRRPVKQKEI